MEVDGGLEGVLVVGELGVVDLAGVAGGVGAGVGVGGGGGAVD